jgi:protein subunit release factor B
MKEVVFSARKKDFCIERMRGSGPGGQHRNKTESCVRITHIESGMSEYCCETRSQHKNLNTAFRRLAKRLVGHYVMADKKERYAAGHKRVRTYHEPYGS